MCDRRGAGMGQLARFAMGVEVEASANLAHEFIRASPAAFFSVLSRYGREVPGAQGEVHPQNSNKWKKNL